MANIITEEMRYRKKVVEYANKHDNNAKAARKYHTNRMQVYVECKKRGYTRTYDSMCKQIRNRKWNKNKEKPKKKYPKSKWKPDTVSYPGEKVQIDIKYVPRECLKFDSFGIRYYQITALDEYSRKRHCEIVDEKSVTHTANFLLRLEENLGFDIHTVQTDNGREFVNDYEVTAKETIFEKT